MPESSQGGFLISRIHHLSGRILTRKMKEHGLAELNPAQGRILFVLWQEANIPIQELANRTSLGKSTLTSMLDRLEKSGFIIRKAAENDRRQTLIARTEKDRRYQAEYDLVSREMTELFYEGFSPSEIETFEGYLERILANLEK